VHIFTKQEDIQRALLYQNGNRGFNDQIDKLAVIVSDLECFTSSGERFQKWIDGGMFAMSLVYALHSLGLGTCCLNWSVDAATDKAFRNAINVKNSEELIMMLAIGNLPEELNVCDSPRKDIHEVLIEH